MRQIRDALLIAGVALMVAFPASAGAQEAPASLTGEHLLGVDHLGTSTGGVEITSHHCQRDGDSTFSFRAHGVAEGPYPGTFEETGTVVIDETTSRVSSMEVRFSIESGSNLITGTKSLSGSGAISFGYCFNEVERPDLAGAFEASYLYLASSGIQGTGSLEYVAEIRTPDGRWRDSGSADSYVATDDAPVCSEAGDVCDVGSQAIEERFTSATGVPTPIITLPETANECKHGGWRTFERFKNQGDCVSFVASKGRNQPAIP
jgi:hypothetical protein